MVAGGRVGILALSHEIGADDRLVGFLQYLRVLIVVLLTPWLAVATITVTAPSAPPPVAFLGDASGWLTTVATATAGAALGRRTRIPGAGLLVPMLLAGAVTLSAPAVAFDVPPLLREAGFATIARRSACDSRPPP